MEIDGRKDFYEPKRFVAEFFASLAIVYTTTLTNIFANESKTTLVAICLNAGMCMMIWSWLLRQRSGGVLNPILALAYAKLGQLPLGSALVYIIVQILGGLFAGGLIYIQLPIEVSQRVHETGNGMPISDDRFTAQAFVLDLLTSAVLTFVVVGLIFDKRSTPEVYGISYGMVACACEIATGTICCGNTNPARSIGPCLVLYHLGTGVWVPVLAQFLGGLLGAILYDEVFNRVPNLKVNVGEEYDNIDNAEGSELLPMEENKAGGNGFIDVDAGIELEVSGGIGMDVEVDVDAEPGFEVEAELDAGIEVEAEIELEAGIEVEAEVELEAGIEIEAEVELDAGIEVEVEAEG